MYRGETVLDTAQLKAPELGKARKIVYPKMSSEVCDFRQKKQSKKTKTGRTQSSNTADKSHTPSTLNWCLSRSIQEEGVVRGLLVKIGIKGTTDTKALQASKERR